MAEGRIQKLDEHVINRIAAGEIIVRPSSAVKELIENSLDAGATSVILTCQKGGMKALRIEDNGHGIRAEDLPILCERFTTSKLRQYEDLRTIATFGFRGEALSSISHVAHVSVTTRTAADSSSHSVSYIDGVMQCPVKSGHRGVGTTIVFEDLFYNMETRRNVISNVQEEYNKIVDVTQKYATHNPHTAFLCKKQQGTLADLRTAGGLDHRGVVQQVYGSTLAGQLLDFTCSSPSPSLTLEAHGLVSNCNWTAKKMELLLFINNRLVESRMIKRMVDFVYATHLPKGEHPWVYLSLLLDPKTLDVNVHPTKKEVQFLEEELIANHLRHALDKLLESTKESRRFQMLKEETRAKRERDTDAPDAARVRVDTRQLRITDMSRLLGDVGKKADWRCPAESAELWDAVQKQRDDLASQTITHSVWVGVVDDQLSLIQFGSALFMINMLAIGQEFAYQSLLRNCRSQAQWPLAMPLEDVLFGACRDADSGFTGTDEDIQAMLPEFLAWAAKAHNQLAPFGFDFSDALHLPRLFPFSPSCPRPLLILRLWKCDHTLEQVLRLVARDAVETLLEVHESQKLWEWMHLSFLSVAEDRLTDGSLVRLVALEQLYKVFERC